MAKKMFKVTVKNDFPKTRRYLEETQGSLDRINFDMYGSRGVHALQSATPKDSGKTAESWSYHIEKSDNHVRLSFMNSNISNGAIVAILIQYGHATRSGAWVNGVDYINPALDPIFKDISNELRKEVDS